MLAPNYRWARTRTVSSFAVPSLQGLLDDRQDIPFDILGQTVPRGRAAAIIAMILVAMALCWLSWRVGSPLMTEIRTSQFNVKARGLRALAPKRRTEATHWDAMISERFGDQVEPHHIEINGTTECEADHRDMATMTVPGTFKV